MKNTIEDVARLAGVSITTVSRVLNNNYPVKKETRQAVENAIKELKYQPNPFARGLIIKKSNTIGIVVPSITNMFFTEVISGFEKYVKLHGYDVLLSNSNGDAASEVMCVEKLINGFVDGIIVVDPQKQNMNTNFYDEIADKIPLICVNGYNENRNVNFIVTDQENGTIKALEYLIKLGHKKIAFVRGGNSHSYDIKEKIYNEFMDKLNSNKIVVDTLDGNSIEVVNNTAKKIININEKKYKIGKDITAFLACNDLMAVGLLNGCSELNIKVPETVSIIGFDNIILSEMTGIKLTTVDQNMIKVGTVTGENIIMLIEGNKLRFSNKIIETKLIERYSCGKCMV